MKDLPELDYIDHDWISEESHKERMKFIANELQEIYESGDDVGMEELIEKLRKEGAE